MAIKRKSKIAETRGLKGRRTETIHPVTLSIDIGGSGLKAMLLDRSGNPISERQRVPTPAIPTPAAVLKGLNKLQQMLPGFDRVSVGFPGVIKRGITYTAANLHPRWALFPLQKELEARWKKLDPTQWAVPQQVDYRLIGSALARPSNRSLICVARRSGSLGSNRVS